MKENPGAVDRIRCTDLKAGRRLEWLVTNNRGGFATATINQMLTRRYHGLLVAAIHPPVERYVLLAKLDATVTICGLTYELATNDFPEAVYPRGYKLLESFSLQPYPTWRWRTGSALIEQALCMVDGEDTTFVRFRLLEGDQPVHLTVRPMCTSRHFHQLTNYKEMGPPNVESNGSGLSFYWSGDRPNWHLSHNGHFKARADWYYGYVLATERQRGYDATQDLFMPGVVSTDLNPGRSAGLIFSASTQRRSWEDHAAAFSSAAARSEHACEMAGENDALADSLSQSGRDFLVLHGGERKTMIAGYPWFGDWGRDTFISLPGLCLVTGRFVDARAIIEAFVEFVDQGMIPNRFPPIGKTPQYNTADAALWYIHAIDRYLTYSGDWPFIVDPMYAVITAILEAHERGARHGIHADVDGLLATGEPGFALTWMDARPTECAITPRIGKPVEINALWYNALCIASNYAKRMNDLSRSEHWRALAQRVRSAFNARFWNEAADCLFDVIDVEASGTGRSVSPVSDTIDSAIRPNQLFAISLTHPVLDETHWMQVVEICQRQLWTPMGLRTLSPTDPDYRGTYKGDVMMRDEAYHQGTAWPWLLGPFVTAYVRAHKQDSSARSRARTFLEGLSSHFCYAGLGGVSEVADGDPPHRPGGCPWQAWSVAEPLRALCEDVLQSHPRPRPTTLTTKPLATSTAKQS